MVLPTDHRVLNILIGLACLVIVAGAIKYSQGLLVPILLAGFLAVLASSPLFWLQSQGVHRNLALAIVLLLSVFLLVLIGVLFFQAGADFSTKLPFYQQRLESLQANLNAQLSQTFPQLQPSVFINALQPSSILNLVASTITSMGNILSNGVLIGLTVVFILAETNSFPGKLDLIRGKLASRDQRLENFLAKTNQYFAIKTSTSFLTGIIVGLGLWLIGVDFPILWALLAIFLNFIPNIGSIIAAIPPIVLALIQLGPVYAVITLGLFILTNTFVGNFIEPKYLGRGLGLSALVVFISLIIWGWLLGPVGMFLSVPLTVAAKIALENNEATKWIAIILGPTVEESDDSDEAQND